MDTAVVILAAGKGTRMNSARPKVLHEVGNFPLISHCIKTAQSIDPKKILVVLGHGKSEIKKFLGNSVNSIDFATQEEQLGTGHAVGVATNELANFDGNLIVLFGDTPFISARTMTKIENGDVGLLFEKDNYSKNTFVIISKKLFLKK